MSKKKSPPSVATNFHEEKTFRSLHFFSNALVYLSFGILIVIMGISKISGDSDFFWHLATGRWIVEHRAIPNNDIFGLISEKQLWIPFEWAWDVLTYLLFLATKSYIAVQLLPILFWLCIFSLLAMVMRKMNISTSIIIIVLLLTLVTTLNRYTPRPHSVTLLSFSIILCLYLTTRISSTKARRLLIVFPLLFLVWANMHMGVIAGILLLIVFFIVEIINFFIKRNKLIPQSDILSQSNLPRIRNLGIIITLCFGAMLVNPFGIQTYSYVSSHLQMKFLQTIQEWDPPFSNNIHQSGVLMMYKILLLLGSVSIVYSIKKKDYLFALLYLTFAVYSLRAVRFIGDFAVLSAIGTAVGIDSVIKSSSIKIQKIFTSTFVVMLLGCIILFSIVTIPGNNFYQNLRYYRLFGFGIDNSSFSRPLIDFLKVNSISGRPFNNLEIGGLLLWEFPEQKFFIDSRNISDDLGKEEIRIMGKYEGFEEKLREFEIDHVIIGTNKILESGAFMESSIISYCSSHKEDWKLVYWDDRSFLYLKNIPKFHHIISKFEFKIFDPYLVVYRGAEFESLKQTQADNFEKEILRKKSEDPQGFIASYLLREIKK
ncbi:MAG: hypothetical protein KGZ58_00700 [Ignavibacteriales bacterium]|nr:hypothetical protein [Ignavibacteriales bacterium]